MAHSSQHRNMSLFFPRDGFKNIKEEHVPCNCKWTSKYGEFRDSIKMLNDLINALSYDINTISDIHFVLLTFVAYYECETISWTKLINSDLNERN